jgi:hypothetical protein
MSNSDNFAGFIERSYKSGLERVDIEVIKVSAFNSVSVSSVNNQRVSYECARVRGSRSRRIACERVLGPTKRIETLGNFHLWRIRVGPFSMDFTAKKWRMVFGFLFLICIAEQKWCDEIWDWEQNNHRSSSSVRQLTSDGFPINWRISNKHPQNNNSNPIHSMHSDPKALLILVPDSRVHLGPEENGTHQPAAAFLKRWKDLSTNLAKGKATGIKAWSSSESTFGPEEGSVPLTQVQRIPSELFNSSAEIQPIENQIVPKQTFSSPPWAWRGLFVWALLIHQQICRFQSDQHHHQQNIPVPFL